MMSKISGLYGITIDNDLDIQARVQAALKGGANIIQYRDKSYLPDREKIAERLVELCHEYDAVLIINDDLDLALATNADGVHLGRDDLDVKAAREKIGDKIIGVSCYNKLELALEAEQQGADYVAFGRFFPSVTKPGAVPAETSLLQEAKAMLSLPIVAIGGITTENAKLLIQAGASSVAVIDGLFNQQNIKKTAEEFSKLFR